MPQDLALVTNKIQNQLQNMHPSIQVLACHGTYLSHQVNQTKTAVQTRTKVNKHEQHPSGTQNKKKRHLHHEPSVYTDQQYGMHYQMHCKE